MKWYGKIRGQKAYGHREGKAWARLEDEDFCLGNTQSKMG